MAETSLPRRLPLTVQTTYADLLTRLQEESQIELGGTPVLRDRGGRKYWYAVQRLGERSVERYLGPDSPALRDTVERARNVREEQRQREKERSRLASMCREGGVPGVDATTGKILRVLAKAGVFRLRGVLVGTHAFRCYPALLGVELTEAVATTEDLDLAAFHSISVALDDRLDPGLAEALTGIAPFVARPSLYEQPTAWRDPESGALVELLIPSQDAERDAPLLLPALGAYAQPLRFLDYLIHEPVQAALLYRSGVLVSVPQPARYAVHKLIVATRRVASATAKAAKDVAQAAVLIRVLAEDRPDELEEAYRDARGRGPSWRAHLDRGVRRLPEDAGRALAESLG